MPTAEQRSIGAISRCEARWLEPDEPKPTCACCGERIYAVRLTYKGEPVCCEKHWNELLERDR